MKDIFFDQVGALSDPDPVRRAQIQMKKPLPKRFYNEATAGEDGEGGFCILLDGRPVKTPAKATLSLPKHPMAALVAEEWAGQQEVINPTVMPVTRLANTAIDGIARDRRAVLEDIVRFSGTDLVCYRADRPERLVAAQAEGWDPIVQWAADTHGARFILAEGVIHQEQPEEAVSAYARAIERYDDSFMLACLHTVTTLTGSALLTLAFADGHIDADEAWRLAHIDEDWQASVWGLDEEAAARRKARKIEMDAACRLFSLSL
jgi:chaperone required for assembly of F1-ATPase